MRNRFVCIATVGAVLFCAAGVKAQTTLVYDMEGASDGFSANGGGTYTQDTIGATEGLNSMKASIPAGATFVGALSDSLHPAIGDPPGVSYVLFDLTLDAAYGGAFADMGVTIFGCDQGGGCGLQAQFKDFVSIAGRAPGTYTDLRIDLDRAHSHPITFEADKSFNEIMGTLGSGPNDLIPTHFQFFFSKSGDAPLVAYIDNVRVAVPEPATIGLLCLGAVVVGATRRRRSR
jgi:hypothetical protein